MNKNILFEKIKKLLKKDFSLFQREYPKGEGLEKSIPNHNLDYNFIINLIKKIIFNDCTKNSIFK
jgi:hypothetical protein